MTDTHFYPFPVLTTPRLVLRQLETTDDKDIFKHRSNAIVNTYLEDFRHASVEQTQAFIHRVQNEIAAGKSILWVITQKGENRFIGSICLWNIVWNERRAEAGYTLDAAFHRMGYMHEALVQVLDFGFNNMELHLIDAYTHELNKGSIKLLQKHHFEQGTPVKAVSPNRAYFALSSAAYKRYQAVE